MDTLYQLSLDENIKNYHNMYDDEKVYLENFIMSKYDLNQEDTVFLLESLNINYREKSLYLDVKKIVNTVIKFGYSFIHDIDENTWEYYNINFSIHKHGVHLSDEEPYHLTDISFGKTLFTQGVPSLLYTGDDFYIVELFLKMTFGDEFYDNLNKLITNFNLKIQDYKNIIKELSQPLYKDLFTNYGLYYNIIHDGKTVDFNFEYY